MPASFIKIAFSQYAIIAFCFGLFFPVFAWLIQAIDLGYPLSLDSLLKIHQQYRVIWVTDAAPLILWLMGCLVSIYRFRTIKQIKTLNKDKKRTQLILDSAPDGILITDAQGCIDSGNRAAHQMFGYQSNELAGKNINSIRPKQYAEDLTEKLAEIMAEGVDAFQVFEQEGLRKDGSRFPVEYSVSLVGDGIDSKIVLVVRDVSERATLEKQLNQARKLEAIGQLSAGIAHEINTPIQYINDNMRAISDYLVDIELLSSGYQQLLRELEQQNLLGKQVAMLRNLEQQCDLEFINQDAPKAMRQSLQGIQRVSDIVKAMKNFSPSGAGQVSMLDINKSIENTLMVARNEYKYIADIELEFGELPLVECHAGELNQVFLNLIVNAAHAIEEKGEQRGTIRITTSVPEAGYIEVSITDNGCGIPEAIQQKVYDPFFTTKEVGKGTGQGLNLAFQTIERQHKGRIYLDSHEGEGTQFRLKIPEKMQMDPSEPEYPQQPRQAIG
ncbi:MAG: PAS domain S-box protein [Pseudomonadales bacterium]|nr:PAS domain S-box protein [Pseudomonadales bacterium]